jgi:hypothetical protein
MDGVAVMAGDLRLVRSFAAASDGANDPVQRLAVQVLPEQSTGRLCRFLQI